MWPRLTRLAGVSAGVGSQICWVSAVPQTGPGGGLAPEPRLIGAGPLDFGESGVKTGKNAERNT